MNKYRADSKLDKTKNYSIEESSPTLLMSHLCYKMYFQTTLYERQQTATENWRLKFVDVCKLLGAVIMNIRVNHYSSKSSYVLQINEDTHPPGFSDCDNWMNFVPPKRAQRVGMKPGLLFKEATCLDLVQILCSMVEIVIAKLESEVDPKPDDYDAVVTIFFKNMLIFFGALSKELMGNDSTNNNEEVLQAGKRRMTDPTDAVRSPEKKIKTGYNPPETDSVRSPEKKIKTGYNPPETDDRGHYFTYKRSQSDAEHSNSEIGIEKEPGKEVQKEVNDEIQKKSEEKVQKEPDEIQKKPEEEIQKGPLENTVGPDAIPMSNMIRTKMLVMEDGKLTLMRVVMDKDSFNKLSQVLN